MPGVWVPVNLTETWSYSPVSHLLHTLVKHLTHRTKRMLGLITAGIDAKLQTQVSMLETCYE